MKNLLITGANGQLGSELRVLSSENKEFNYFFTDINELDILDQAAVDQYITENEIDTVVNCAAYTAVDKAEDNQELCHRLNALAPGYLAQAVEKRKGSLIQISTDYVFDGTAHIPYKETAQTCPASTYGRTKLEGEENARKACEQTTIIRTAWLYSIYGNNFVKTMLRLGKERDELGVVADQIGTPTYARDLARAIYTAIHRNITPGVYHFSNEGVCSWYDFTKAIHYLAGIKDCHVRPLHTEEYPTPAQRPHYSVLDKTKIRSTLQIEIPHWFDSLSHCICLLKNLK